MDQELTQSTRPQSQQRIGVGQAHSKIILMGEHAVVYGIPAIAIPYPTVGVRVTVTHQAERASTIESLYHVGTLATLPDKMANIRQVIETTVQSFDLSLDHLAIAIDSQIPVGRGMGSSAAVAVALVRALCDYYQVTISDQQLHLIVNQGEVIAHETTSGLDTLMASSLQPVMYQKSEPPVPFELGMDAIVILADSGIVGETKHAVSKVRRQFDANSPFVTEALQSIERFVKMGYQAIQENDPVELGRLMTYNHYYLNQLGVSHPALDRIVNAAWYAGALGAKLTGGGLGGCAIALAQTVEQADAIETAMRQAGAQQTWQLQIMK